MDTKTGLPSEANDLFRALVEQSLGLMCVHDLEGNLLFVNTAAAETLGFRPEDGIGWNLRRYLAPSIEREFDGYLERIPHQRSGQRAHARRLEDRRRACVAVPERPLRGAG